jgi:hypothetical protein
VVNVSVLNTNQIAVNGLTFQGLDVKLLGKYAACFGRPTFNKELNRRKAIQIFSPKAGNISGANQAYFP